MQRVILSSLTALVVGLSGVGAVFAQGNGGELVNRNANQQQRIEQGLRSGALTTREAARLEREQAGVARAESRALRDGQVSAAERDRINRMENRASRDIYAQKHDAQQGNPDSASAKRMAANAQRSANQQRRIGAGIADGSLTGVEAARLERGQARVDRAQARAGADGHVGRVEQAAIGHRENVQSRQIYRQRHDRQVR